MKKAVVYINLGTPSAPKAWPVSLYLRQFLMDPFVLDIPWFLRWLLVNFIIVPFRSRKSAHAYKQIWTESGSPLMVNSEKLVLKLEKQLQKNFDGGWDAFLAMRYGEPSINSVLQRVIARGYDEIYLMPAYPQYALSSTETALDEAEKVLRRTGFNGRVFKIQDYYNEPGFISAVSDKLATVRSSFKPDHILFSYHGLPKRHLSALHPECAFNSECCAKIWAENRNCYRHQTFMTTAGVVEKLGLHKNDYTIAYQSRLGSGWIQPFSDVVIAELAQKGIQRLAVISPSFTADCLETLEEIAIRSSESFRAAGGSELVLVPCVNDSELWVSELAELLQDQTKMTMVELK